MHYGTNEESPKVIKIPVLIYPVTMQEWPPDDRKPQSYAEVNWIHVEMINLKRFKEAGLSYAMHSPLVKQMLNSWATRSRIISED